MSIWDDDNPWGKWGKKFDQDESCGYDPYENDKDEDEYEDEFDFDQKSVLMHKIINAICILKREIAKCEEILLNPKFGLKEIKREVRNIERGVFSPTFGLPEIKREVRGIERGVFSPTFGLPEIKREVRNIERGVFSPTFGLPEIKSEVSEILSLISNLNIVMPTFLLADIKSEVSAIESAVFSSTFGLEEIKSEVSMVATAVAGIMDQIGNPTFGLSEIKAEVSDILAIAIDIVTNPVFGLSEIKAEVSSIESAVFSSTFGLSEIKAEVSQILANQGTSPFLTTGPFFVDCEEQTLHLKALNNSNVTQSVTFTVRNLVCPVTQVENIFLTIPACCGNHVEVPLPGSGERNLEVRAIRSSAIDVLVYLATKTALPNCQGTKVNEFKHAEWVPVATFCS